MSVDERPCLTFRKPQLLHSASVDHLGIDLAGQRLVGAYVQASCVGHCDFISEIFAIRGQEYNRIFITDSADNADESHRVLRGTLTHMISR